MRFKAKCAIISKLETWDPSISYVSFDTDVLDGTRRARETGAASWRSPYLTTITIAGVMHE